MQVIRSELRSRARYPIVHVRARGLTAAAFCLVTSTAVAFAGQPRYSGSTASASIEGRAVHVYVDEEAAAPDDSVAALPSNVAIPHDYETAVRRMLRRSPTFRRQCARLAAAEQLRVTVRTGMFSSTHFDYAQTRIAVDAGRRMQADVDIRPLSDLANVLPHEFEHILEQLDEVDLAALARLRRTGVHLTSSGQRFETARAIATGRQVAREVGDRGRRGGQ